MLNNSTLKRTFLIGFVLCMFATACSDDGGRGEQPAAPDTTTTTTEVVETSAPTTTLEVVVVEPQVDDTTTTTSEPVVTEPPEPVHGVVPLPPEVEELLRPEPVVVTAPPTTAPATTAPEPTAPETTEAPSTTAPPTTAPATTVPSGPVSEPIVDGGAMWAPDCSGFDPEQGYCPPPQAVSDPVYLVPGMALTYTTEIDRLQPQINGAVVTKFFFYEKPQQTYAHICVEGATREWAMRLARTDTPDVYQFVYVKVTILTTGEKYHRPQISYPDDAEPC